MKDLLKFWVAMLPLLLLALVPEIIENTLATVLLILIAAFLLFGWAMKEFTLGSLSFMLEPDARKVSRHRYGNGNAMSVKEAKSFGLYE